MSDTAAMRRIGSGAGRVARAWRSLDRERRLAALAAIGLLLCLFMPWYQETVITHSRGSTVVATGVTLTGWGAFSFVEAVVLLVAAGVLALLFVRAEGRAALTELDGPAILGAGGFTCVLVLWRIFDKQGTSGHGQFTTASGIDWGIIFGLGAAVLLTYAGSRIRIAHQTEPPLPGGSGPGPPRPPAAPSPQPPKPATRAPIANDPAATRVSQRQRPDAAADGPAANDAAATRVAAPRGSSSRGGPPVTPEEPPTMRLENRDKPRAPASPEQQTLPLDEG